MTGVQTCALPISAPTSTAAPAALADTSAASSAGSTQRVLGWTAVGAGAVGLTLGVIFELKRSSKLSSRDAICPSGMNCTPSDSQSINSLTSDAKSASTIGTIGLVGGGVLAAAGIVLVVSAPSSDAKVGALTVTPLLAPGFGGLSLTTHLF